MKPKESVQLSDQTVEITALPLHCRVVRQDDNTRRILFEDPEGRRFIVTYEAAEHYLRT